MVNELEKHTLEFRGGSSRGVPRLLCFCFCLLRQSLLCIRVCLQAHCEASDGLELLILLPQPPKYSVGTVLLSSSQSCA